MSKEGYELTIREKIMRLKLIMLIVLCSVIFIGCSEQAKVDNSQALLYAIGERVTIRVSMEIGMVVAHCGGVKSYRVRCKDLEERWFIELELQKVKKEIKEQK